MARNYKQGTYEVINKDKYIGHKNPRYLSSYELEVWRWCDRSPAVVRWGAEVVIVPYMSEVKGRKSRYIVDLYVEFVDRHGVMHKELIEIKPYAQTQKPVKKSKSKNTFIQESLTFQNNQEKWEAATKYAKERGWVFRILTEKQIFK